MSIPLPDAFRSILDAPEYAVVATVQPDGRPQLSVVWIKRDGDDILFSTVRGRQKTKNIERDPRVTVLVYPKDNPYSYFEARGTATLVDDDGPGLIDELSRKYTGGPWTADAPGTPRVIVRVSADRITSH